MARLRWPGPLLLCIVFFSLFILSDSLLAQQAPRPNPSPYAQRSGTSPTGKRARPAKGNPAAALAERYAPDRVLVRFRAEATTKLKQNAHAQAGAKQTRKMRIVPGLEIVQLKPGVRVGEALRQYRRDPSVLYAEPDYRVHHMGQPNDPMFSSLWGLHNTGQSGGTADADIDAPEAWNITTGNADIVVGVIDTGVDYTHPDLEANIWRNEAECTANGVDDDGNGYVDDCHGINTIYGTSDPMDDYGHGTHVAGTIGALGNNSLGVVGVNWTVKIAACKFLGWDGYGYDSGAIACLEYFKALHDAGLNLVATNNSWGGGGYNQALYDAIDAHRQAGILFIAAAGNESSNNDTWLNYPSSFDVPNIVAVAATTRTDSLASFSNYGPSTVHLGAPGDEILSTVPNGGYEWNGGTSMATPHVTGLAALLKAHDPGYDWRAIKNLILSSGDTIPALAQTITGKRLNANGALTCSNSELLRRVKPNSGIASTVPGIALEFEVLHINCAAPGGDVTAIIDPGGIHVALRDDGAGTDQEAGDGIYSGQWMPTSPGSYTLTITGTEPATIFVLNPYKFETASYQYRDIAGTSFNFSAGWNEFAWLDTPFRVQFGGGSFTRLGVSLNGTISATDPFQSYWWTPLPAAGAATLVAPSWTALWGYADTPRNVFWAVRGTSPNRELVIEWRDLEGICWEPTGITFQAVFFEGKSDVLFNYKDMVMGVDIYGNDCTPYDNGGGATSGVQVGTRVATQYSYEEPLLTDGTALRWTLGSPAPAVRDVAPFSAAVGEPGISVDVWGNNFVPSTVVQWNDSGRPTEFVDSTYLRADIPASDLTTAGTAEVTVSTPNGGTSEPHSIRVYDSYPVAVIDGTDPVQAMVGTSELWLWVRGSKFLSKSVVRVNGSDRESYPQSDGLVVAYLPATDFEHAGTLQVTAFNPTPGGGQSNASAFTVNNYPPQVASWTPLFARAGSPGMQFQFVGYTFDEQAVVRWNGADRPTTVVPPDCTVYCTPATATADISASDLAQPGMAQVTLFNPPPGGGESSAVSLDILLPPANDEVAQSIDFATLPFQDSRDIRAATAAAGDPVASCVAPLSPLPSNTVWYRFEPGASGWTAFSAQGGAWNSAISVWTGGPGAWTEVACATHQWFGVSLTANASVTAGTSYWVVVNSDETSTYNPFVFFADAAAPQPVLSAVTPAVVASGWETTLHATGSGFVNGSHLHWDGVDMTSALVSATELTATLPATAVPTLHGVVIHTPEPGGGMSSSIDVRVAGYQLAASPSTATVNPGQSATYTITVTPDTGGYDKTVTLACMNPPSGISCSFSTPSGTPGTSAMTSTLTVTASVSLARTENGGGTTYLALLLLPLLGCVAAGIPRRKRARIAAGSLLVVALVLPLLSCGGGSDTPPPPPPPSTYTINVGANSGTMSQTTTVTLKVQH